MTLAKRTPHVMRDERAEMHVRSRSASTTKTPGAVIGLSNLYPIALI